MKVLVFPKDDNPYQGLLYGAIDQTVEVTYVKKYPYIGALLFPITIFYRRLQGYRLIHIHWPAFTIGVKIPQKKRLSYYLFKVCLGSLKLLRFKVVWTVHNILPHEQQTLNDLNVARSMSDLASVVIVHSSETIRQMKEEAIKTDNVTVVPIGPYNNLYPDNINPLKARQKLHIKSDEFVVLFFGLVRSYKGVEDLMNVLGELKLPKLRLLVAGKCNDEKLAGKLLKGRKHVEISFYNQFVPDAEVATYFRACNVVCLPFRKITTSSSALLAMSFGKAVIAPKLGALIDIPTDAAMLYDASSPGGLKSMLKSAISNRRLIEEIGRAGHKYSSTLSWETTADATYKVYEEILKRDARSIS